MKPVMQTIVAGADEPMPGNCLQAAVASIFDLPMEDVPHFVAEPDWTRPLRRWCADRGVYPIDVSLLGEEVWNHHAEVVHVVIGGSPRLPGETHACVGLGGRIIHDPHPDGTGLTDLRMAVFFAALEPSRFAPSAPTGQP